jgi:hypothetical protein
MQNVTDGVNGFHLKCCLLFVLQSAQRKERSAKSKEQSQMAATYFLFVVLSLCSLLFAFVI